MQKAFSSPRSCIKILQVGEKMTYALKSEKRKEKTRHYDGSFLERENVWLG
jgi:hypothetical protein